MKKHKFEIIWIFILIVIMSITYYFYGNNSAKTNCQDMMAALTDSCIDNNKLDALLDDMEPTIPTKEK